MWIARDKLNGTLKLFVHKPVKGTEVWLIDERYRNNIEHEVLILNDNSFRNVTWETYPEYAEIFLTDGDYQGGY